MRVQYSMSQKRHTLDIKKRGHCSEVLDNLIEPATEAWALTLLPSSHGLLLNTSNELNHTDHVLENEMHISIQVHAACVLHRSSPGAVLSISGLDLNWESVSRTMLERLFQSQRVKGSTPFCGFWYSRYCQQARIVTATKKMNYSANFYFREHRWVKMTWHFV